MSLAVSVVKRLIQLSQFTPFHGRGNWGSVEKKTETQPSPEAQDVAKAQAEADDLEALFRHFPEHDLKSLIAGKDVLDLGSGYGGRTVEYRRKCAARSVAACEPFERHISAGKAFAKSLAVDQVDFRLCDDLTIPFDDNAFDIVLSYDVLEHVLDPRATIREVHRVLRPGGKAFIVFPPYEMVIAHHLDYITMFPGLHWIFGADTIVKAVNGILESPEGKRFNTQPQPLPKLSYRGDTKVLPSLNGLRSAEFVGLCDDFEIMSKRRRPLLSNRLGPNHVVTRSLGLVMKLSDRMADRFCQTFCIAIQKPA